MKNINQSMKKKITPVMISCFILNKLLYSLVFLLLSSFAFAGSTPPSSKGKTSSFATVKISEDNCEPSEGTDPPSEKGSLFEDNEINLPPMTILGGVDLGDLPDYHMFFADGRTKAKWQGASKGFVGDVAVDGLQATEETSGSFAFAGTIYTNDNTLNAWQDIVDNNTAPNVTTTQAFGALNETTRITDLETDLTNAFTAINALTATSGYESVSSTSLDGLNTQNSTAETFVINITSGLQVSSLINITGDAGDIFVLRWDTDPNTTVYDGEVKFQGGGAVVPLGGLIPTNFINVAGKLNSSGGGSNPPSPYPQGPRTNDGTGSLVEDAQDFNGGGFFTGYWLTTGDPGGGGENLSNAIFVGGLYTTSQDITLTSGTSGVYVSPPTAAVACALNITDVSVGTCSYNTNTNQSEAQVSVEVSWSNPPAGEDVTVSLNGQDQTIDVDGGATSPATLNFTVPADGSTGNAISAIFTGNTCSDPDGDTYDAPGSCAPVTNPIIGLAKQATIPTNNNDGTYDVTYRLQIQNLGNVALYDIVLTDVLNSEFGTYQASLAGINAPGTYGVVAAPSVAENSAGILTAFDATDIVSGYTGVSGSNETVVNSTGKALPVGEYFIVEFTIRFYPNTTDSQYDNSATVTADDTDGASGTPTTDISENGGCYPAGATGAAIPSMAVDPDCDGNPNESGENDPTPVIVDPANICAANAGNLNYSN